VTFEAISQISRPTEFIQQPFDIIEYDASLELLSAPLPILEHGLCNIRVAWTDIPQGILPLHLRDLTIDSVKVNGLNANYSRKGNTADDTMHYAIEIPSSIQKGDTTIVAVHYHGTMGKEPPRQISWGGVYSTKRILYAIGTGFFANYVGTTQHWMPCYDHPSDKALLKTRILVPKGKMAISNGILETIDTLEQGMRFTWSMDKPLATYLMTFAVDSFQKHVIGNANNAVYAIKQDSVATAISFSQLPRMIATLEKSFGDYPFRSVGYVLTPTGSMEHQTMISIDESIVRKKDSNNSTILHELAHQWFGDKVTPRDYGYHWLSESFATYAECLWAEELKGQAGYIQDVQAKITEYFGNTIAREGVMPLEKYGRSAPSSNYPRTIYIKGAVILGMLRHHMGDSLFFQALKTYLERYRYGNAITEDFQKACEDISGTNLQWFFDQWIKRKGWPRIQIDTSTFVNGDIKSMRMKIAQVQSQDYGMFQQVPLQIGFRLPDNSFEYRTITFSGPETIINIDSLPEYRSMSVNQGNALRSLVQIAKVTGIESAIEHAVNAIYVYPNPGSTKMTIEYPLSMQGSQTISVIDINGKIIREWNVDIDRTGLALSAQIDIDVSGISPGTYIITMKNNYQSLSTNCIITQ
jgi:aminopeptidase N